MRNDWHYNYLKRDLRLHIHSHKLFYHARFSENTHLYRPIIPLYEVLILLTWTAFSTQWQTCTNTFYMLLCVSNKVFDYLIHNTKRTSRKPASILLPRKIPTMWKTSYKSSNQGQNLVQ